MDGLRRLPPDPTSIIPFPLQNNFFKPLALTLAAIIHVQYTEYNTIQYNTKFVKRHVAVASEALANRRVKKHRRRRTNVL